LPTQEDVLIRVREFDERFPIPSEDDEKQAPKPLDVLSGLM
jgi:hypothetical protein